MYAAAAIATRPAGRAGEPGQTGRAPRRAAPDARAAKISSDAASASMTGATPRERDHHGGRRGGDGQSRGRQRLTRRRASGRPRASCAVTAGRESEKPARARSLVANGKSRAEPPNSSSARIKPTPPPCQPTRSPRMSRSAISVRPASRAAARNSGAGIGRLGVRRPAPARRAAMMPAMSEGAVVGDEKRSAERSLRLDRRAHGSGEVLHREQRASRRGRRQRQRPGRAGEPHQARHVALDPPGRRRGPAAGRPSRCPPRRARARRRASSGRRRRSARALGSRRRRPRPRVRSGPVPRRGRRSASRRRGARPAPGRPSRPC